ncbi:hypothetical protein BHYA_0011g00680 [Botrytis hyacinthi]|uniref:Uncharacterized protein n=1 Tax=Botrytis hyacinthi TaxID=278943 RepID=A0A4Z1GZ17_9HELO|nr:hypothetical protein BHYA_0011g00680 [Botrytis hyacinthi]
MLRRQLRRVLLVKRFGLQFIEDRVGVFDIPGLEIDTEVDGLMVVRGMTLRLSAMSLVVHGVEVGLKMVVGEGEEEEEIEIGIACEEVVVRLGRVIEVGDCFVSVKGGEGELSFKDAEDGTARKGGDEKGENEVWEVDSKMLRAVKGNEVEFENGTGSGNVNVNQNEARMVKPDMVDGHAPINTDVKECIKVIRTITPDDTEAANEQYNKTIEMIRSTNSIEICRQEVQYLVQSKIESNLHSTYPRETVNENSNNDIRAAICSQLHRQPSITHPPSRSIKVTTLQTLAPPHIRAILHRLPMLLRLLLNPLAHFHPVKISSLTATGSGKWIQEILSAKLFKNTTIYTPPSSPISPLFPSTSASSASCRPSDPTDDDESAVPKIQQRINECLLPANFVLQLGSITGLAQVPFLSTYDIHCSLSTTNILAYRTLPSTISLKQVVRLGGADATFAIPSFLLPHHEHILPAQGASCKVASREEGNGDGKTNRSTGEKIDDASKEDECVVRIAAHAQLPIVMDQELLDWVASVVKASKVVEVEKEKRWMDEEIHGFRDLVEVVKGGVKDAHKGMKKTLVSATVNDKWIAKMVGKVTKKLEEAKGDIGYAADIKVPLGPYRLGEEARERGEGDKILP